MTDLTSNMSENIVVEIFQTKGNSIRVALFIYLLKLITLLRLQSKIESTVVHVLVSNVIEDHIDADYSSAA